MRTFAPVKTIVETVCAILVFVLLLPSKAQAQTLSDTLNEVRISDVKLKDTTIDVRQQFAAGQQLQQIDKTYKDLYKMQSVAQLLAQQTPVFIKSYGINGLATLTFRGASAAQSAVLWNGVPILNPALGVADVSLLNSGLFDNLALQYGGSAALFGSGNVGGALALGNNDATFTQSKDAAITLGAGSFGRKDFAAKASYQNRRWRVAFRSFYQQANNDFDYLNTIGIKQKISNAQLNAAGALLSVDYKFKNESKNEHIIGAQLWMQRYRREIPPALFEQGSEKLQTDASIRSLVSWHRKINRNYFYAKASYNREYLRYQYVVVLPDNSNTVGQYYQEIGWRHTLNKTVDEEAAWLNSHQFLVFSPLQYAVASGENISNTEYQFRPAIVAAYNIQAFKNKLSANISGRQEWVNSVAAPILPGLGAGYKLLQERKDANHFTLQLRANVQRTYRIPALNELYYFPGGNKNLKPEQGWSQDAGYQFIFQKKHQDSDISVFEITHDVSVFNRNIQDWIYWMGGAIWTPYNIAKVHSRGMETDNKLSLQVANFRFHIGAKVAYVLSTTEDSYLPGDGSKGKQIPYTPRYNGQGNIGCSSGKLFLNYNHTYTGYRFTTIDESQFIMPYQTGNLQAMYTLQKQQYAISISAQLQNIWNQRYEVVNARPMPGRNFLLSLQLGWKG